MITAGQCEGESSHVDSASSLESHLVLIQPGEVGNVTTPSFHVGKLRGTERLSYLPKITQPVSGRARIQTHADRLKVCALHPDAGDVAANWGCVGMREAWGKEELRKGLRKR